MVRQMGIAGGGGGREPLFNAIHDPRRAEKTAGEAEIGSSLFGLFGHTAYIVSDWEMSFDFSRVNRSVKNTFLQLFIGDKIRYIHPSRQGRRLLKVADVARSRSGTTQNST